jgi:hypothetical protein
LNEEVSEIKRRLQTMSDLIDCTVLQNHYLQLRMNQMLDHVGVRRTELTTGSPGLDECQQGLINAVMERRRARGATNNPAIPPQTAAATPPQAAAATPPQAGPPTTNQATATPPTNPPNNPNVQVPRQMRAPVEAATVNNTLVRHSVLAAGNKGRAKTEEDPCSALIKMYQQKENYVFSHMGKENGQLEDRYSVVFAQVFQHGDRRLLGVSKKIMKLVDCMWTDNERERVVNG